MRKLVFLFTIAAFVACNSNDTKVQSATDTDSGAVKKADMPEVTYPYEMGYSSKFEMGDPQQSKKILELWKDFDNADLAAHKDYFADSVEMLFYDGGHMHSSRDSIIASANSYRAMYSSVTSRVDAVVPLKSTDKNENWVTVWGTEVHTMKGKTDSIALQETWRFNKDGKVDFLLQYKRDLLAAKK